jgi:hypothetical protein
MSRGRHGRAIRRTRADRCVDRARRGAPTDRPQARTLERRGACIADPQISKARWVEFRVTEAHARPTEQHDRDLQRSRSPLWDAQLEPVGRRALGLVQVSLGVAAQLLGHLPQLIVRQARPLFVKASGTALDPLLRVRGQNGILDGRTVLTVAHQWPQCKNNQALIKSFVFLLWTALRAGAHDGR